MYSFVKNFWKIETTLKGKFGVFHIYFISCQDYDIALTLQKLNKTY